MQEAKAFKTRRGGYVRPSVPRRRTFSEPQNGFRLSP